MTEKIKVWETPNGKQIDRNKVFKEGAIVEIYQPQEIKNVDDSEYSWIKICYGENKTEWVAKEFLEELPKPITGYRYQYKWEKSQYVTQDFKDKVAGISRELGIDPDDLMAVMAFESRFNPAQKNLAGGSATGLVQFMPIVAEELNTTTSKLAQMEGVEQLDYVFGYLYSEKGKIKTLDDIYMKVLCPEAIGKSDNYPIYSKGDNRYEANKNLDLDKDGIISKESIRFSVIKKSRYIHCSEFDSFLLYQIAINFLIISL